MDPWRVKAVQLNLSQSKSLILVYLLFFIISCATPASDLPPIKKNAPVEQGENQVPKTEMKN